MRRKTLPRGWWAGAWAGVAGLAALSAVAALALVVLAVPGGAAAKGLDTMGARGGAVAVGVDERYQTLTPIHPKPGGRWTTVIRTDRHDGRLSRWWRLRGSWIVPAVAYDRSGASLAGDGSRLVLSAFRYAYPRPGRWSTRFAVLDTGPHLRPLRGGGRPAAGGGPVRRITLAGDWDLLAVSPRGDVAFLVGHPRAGAPAPYVVRALDTATGRLAPRPLFDSRRQRRSVEGVPVTSLATWRWSYTLYYAGRGRPGYLQALDTATGSLTTVALPLTRRLLNPMLARLRLVDGGRRLALRGRPTGAARRRTLLRIDRDDLSVRPAPAYTAAARAFGFLFTPAQPGNLMGRLGVAGRSVAGREIRVRQWGDPARAPVMVVGCIHGDECAGGELQPRFVRSAGCPDPEANLVIVHNLDPDGRAADTRLNARGVDLNRNFPASWRRIGRPGDPQYSGPRPFSEPESRLAARLVRAVRPRVTIWFHQHTGPGAFVRAWGQSAPAGRRFARLAGIPFRLLPWPDGTAPNWQNHAFPGTSSFVVELPAGARLREGPLARRLGAAEALLAHQVGQDGHVAKG